MKRIIMMMVLAFAGFSNMQAQEIYTEVMNMAKERVNDPAASDIVKEINQFKVNALTYMALTMREKMPDAPADLLDAEALALYKYVDLYMSTIVKNSDQPAAYQTKLIKLFIEVSLATPLFNDTDKETVYAYTEKEDAFIRFSLDTNWVEAMKTVEEKLKDYK